MLNPGHYHLVGTAGVGMSALAQALVAAGCKVTGSDRYFDQGENLPVIEQLRRAGITFCKQDGSGVTSDTRAVVLSTAIETDNHDVQAARRLTVPLLHRSVILAQLAEGKRCVAVTGTSGKSTVTGLIGWILDVAGWDPVVINGAPVLNWADADHIGNFRAGRGEVCVIEADESDRSLLNYAPDWAVITNASHDHFDLDETRRLFTAFKNRVRTGLVSTLDEPELIESGHLLVERESVRVVCGGETYTAPLLGLHNAENVVLAATLCMRLGVKPAAIREALLTFRGISRRLERIGTARGVLVVDDYAHNPAKIRAAWQTLVPNARRVHGIWRPHGFGPLRAMLDGLTETFDAICRPDDRVLILPVFDAGGTADRSMDAHTLVRHMHAQGLHAAAVDDVDAVPEIVARVAGAGDVVLTMGARDPHLPALARAILARISRPGSARGAV